MQIERLKQQMQANLMRLEERVADLLAQREELARDNDALRHRQAELLAERDELIQKHEQARSRIEAMVARLQGLEQTTP
jgi:cell division protein ZapB